MSAVIQGVVKSEQNVLPNIIIKKEYKNTGEDSGTGAENHFFFHLLKIYTDLLFQNYI